jgi:MFS family permease
MEELSRQPRVYYGWWIVVLLFYTLLHTAGNGFYGSSVFMPRIIDDLGITTFAFTAVGTIWAVVFGLSSPLIGGWLQRYGPRKVFIVGISAAGVVSLLYSFATELWHLAVFNVAAGVMAAATILVPTQYVITTWFDRYRGRAMALAMMGIGFGGFLIPLLITWFVTMVGWRGAFQIGAVLNYIIVLPPILLFLKDRPADVGQRVDGLPPDADGGIQDALPVGVSASRAVRSGVFWFILAVYLLQLYVQSGVQMNTQNFAERELGYSLGMAPLFIAFALAVTIPMRFVMGWLCDRIDPKFVMAVAGLFLAAASTVVWLGLIELGWNGYGAIWVFAALQGTAISANAIGLPILVGRCFGAREFGRIIGLVMMSFAVGVILGPPSLGLIFDVTGSYQLAYIFTTVAALLSVVAALLIRTRSLHSEFTTGEEQAGGTDLAGPPAPAEAGAGS